MGGNSQYNKALMNLQFSLQIKFLVSLHRVLGGILYNDPLMYMEEQMLSKSYKHF